MQATYPVRQGDAAQAFELGELSTPPPGQRRVAVDGFGLNQPPTSPAQITRRNYGTTGR